MSLTTRIEQDYIAAYKAKDALRLGVLRLLKTAAKNLQVELMRPVTDEELATVIQKQAKQRQDSIEQFSAANRPDLAEKEAAEKAAKEQAEKEAAEKAAAEQAEKEAAEKAAAEQAAKEQAEKEAAEKVAAEQAAAAATAQAAQEQAAAQQSETVYITPSGKRWHRSASCAGKNAREVTMDQVGNRTPCKKCA